MTSGVLYNCPGASKVNGQRDTSHLTGGSGPIDRSAQHIRQDRHRDGLSREICG